MLVSKTSTELLPSFKIATINQEVLKDATSNFMDDFFQLLQHYSHQPNALLHHFFPHHPPCFSLIPATLTKGVSQCPLTYSYRLTSLSLNVNRAQTGFPIPTLKRNTLKDLEQEVLSYDKLYLNLRGKNLVLDFSNTEGLQLFSQYLKKKKM